MARETALLKAVLYLLYSNDMGVRDLVQAFARFDACFHFVQQLLFIVQASIASPEH